MIDSGFCTQPTVVVGVNVASSISPSVYIVEMPSSHTVDNDKKVQAKSLLDPLLSVCHMQRLIVQKLRR